MSCERQDLNRKSKTAGKLFNATGGQHFNCDDVFMSYERKDREKLIKENNNEKKRQQELASKTITVITILAKNKTQVQHNGVKYLKVRDIRVLVKWKTKVQVALEDEIITL